MRKTILAVGVLLLSLFIISPFGQVIIQGVQQLGAVNFTSAPVTSSVPFGFSAGNSSAPSIYLIGTPGMGCYFPSTTNMYCKGTGFGVGGYGTGAVFLTGSAGAGQVAVASLGLYSFSSSSNEQGVQDTGISRTTAGVLGVGTGAQGSTAGTIAATKLQLTSFVFANIGTVLTVNGQEGYCSDCTVATIASCPATQASCICAGSGSGAIARFVNSTAYCTP